MIFSSPQPSSSAVMFSVMFLLSVVFAPLLMTTDEITGAEVSERVISAISLTSRIPSFGEICCVLASQPFFEYVTVYSSAIDTPPISYRPLSSVRVSRTLPLPMSTETFTFESESPFSRLTFPLIVAVLGVTSILPRFMPSDALTSTRIVRSAQSCLWRRSV